MRNIIHFFFLLFINCAAYAQTYTINSVAGQGTQGFAGDGGQAISAKFYWPNDIIADANGNLFIADCFNHRIRKIDSTGIITTIAGTGTQGWSGDGGPATSAQLSTPVGFAFDASGNLHFTESGCVRKVNSSGIISTVAGTGFMGFSGDGGLATSAQLKSPHGVAFDASGNMYITDGLNHRIRKVDLSGIITTICGTGTVGFSGDGGQASLAQISNPCDIFVDATGNIIFSDYGNRRLRKIDPLGIITTIAGTGGSGFTGDGGPATSAQIGTSEGLEYISSTGEIFLADHSNNRIRKINSLGIISTIAGNGTAGSGGDGGPALSAQFNGAICICQKPATGILYVGEYLNYKIRILTTGTSCISPSLTINTGSITCFGGNDGTASITATGGTGNLTYTWMPIGGNTTSVSSLTAGNYTCYVHNSCGYYSSQTVNVTSPPMVYATTGTLSSLCFGNSGTLTASGAGGVGPYTYTWSTGATTPTITINPTVTTTYTIYTKDANGCQAANPFSIWVYSNPTVSAVSSLNNFCSGTVITLTASGASTYTWSTGAFTPSTNVMPGVTTTYTVIGKNSFGAGCTNTAAVTVTVIPSPTLNITFSPTLICTGQSATLSVNGANTYTWNTGSNNTAIVVSPTIMTTYSVAGTATNGCTRGASGTLLVSGCTTVENLSESADFSLYPNPNNGSFVIKHNVETDHLIMEIYNSIGELIEKRKLSEITFVELKEKPNGIYFLKIISGEGLIYKANLIKQ